MNVLINFVLMKTVCILFWEGVFGEESQLQNQIEHCLLDSSIKVIPRLRGSPLDDFQDDPQKSSEVLTMTHAQ